MAAGLTAPAALFHRAGVALFGDQYVAPLAVALGVPKNTVGKWRDGKSRVPAGIWDEMRSLTYRRRDDCNQLILDISRLRVAEDEEAMKP